MGKKPTYQELERTVKNLKKEFLTQMNTDRDPRHSEKEFRGLADLLPGTVFEMDLRGIITFVNSATLAATGYTEEDLEKGFEAITLLIPEDRERARENIRQLMNGEDIGTSRYTVQRKDGTRFPAIARSAPILRDGKVLGLRGFIVDISKSEQAEETLRESEEKYRQLFATESDAIIIFHADTGKFLDVNDAAVKLYGYSRDEFLKITIADVSAEPDATRIAIENTITGRISRIPLRYHKKKDGTRFPVEISTSTFLLHGLKVLCGAVRDITDRVRMEEELGKYRGRLEDLVKERTRELEQANELLRQEIAEHARAEAALRESKETSRALLDALADVAALLDPRGIFLDANNAMAQRLGRSRDELIGASAWDVFPPDIAARRKSHYDQVIHSGESVRFEDERDGRSLDNIYYPILDAHGNVMKVALLARDITARRQAEEALRISESNYRAIFNAANDAIFVHDAETGQILDVNQKMCAMYGCSPEEARELTVHDISSGKPGYIQEDALRWIRKAAKGEPQLFEWMARDRSGRLFWVEVNLKRAVIGDRERLLAVVRDITVRKQMEEELAKVQRLESLGILAGGIAHDFNNMLTAIMANISMAKMYGGLQDDILQLLIDAEVACFRAKGLTQQLLTFAKGGEPITKPIRVQRLLRETARFALSGSRMSCEFSIPDDLWLVEADEAQISQVIQNLVINADQAMAEGGVIKIRAENVILGEDSFGAIKGGAFVRISVQDQGCGIPGRHLSKVFDPFFSTKEKGRGLGLSISFSIVKRHGGRMHVESEVGVGTLFDVYLPAAEEPSADKEGERVGPVHGEGRVLLIDDEEIIRRPAKEMLNRMGYEVELAADGAEGIELYKNARDSGRPFQAVIMDLTIPGGMGGEQAIRELVEIDPHAKVIVSSGYSNDPLMSNFREYGFSGVVQKPYTIEDLAAVLHKVIMEVDCPHTIEI